MAALPWAAATVVLLALADAGQAALARVFTDAYNRFMQKLPLHGGNAMKPSTGAQAGGAEDTFQLPPLGLGWRQAGLVWRALGSFSVWPFYGALLVLLGAVHWQMAVPWAVSEKAGRDAGAPTVKPAQTVMKTLPLKQGEPLSPQKPATPPPGVRFPPAPQNRFPATRLPGQIATPPKAPDVGGAGGTPAK